MKYMLMMNHPGKGPYALASWPREDIRAHIRFMKDSASELTGCRDHERAVEHYRRAADRTASPSERAYLLERAARLVKE